MDQRWCLSELMNMKAWLTTADKILNKWANQAGDVQACIPEFSGSEGENPESPSPNWKKISMFNNINWTNRTEEFLAAKQNVKSSSKFIHRIL